MKVSIVSITKPLIKDIHNPDDLLVYIARVSNPNNQMNFKTSGKLLSYLIKNKHWSPFDMINLTVEVTTSRAISTQILRHWSIHPQEFSQRYAEATEFEPIELRKAGSTNRQSSEEPFDPPITDKWGIIKEDSIENASRLINKLQITTYELYKELIDAGVANECARNILPLNTSTTLYLNGTVRSWIHYLGARLDPHTQKEHREIAEQVLLIFKDCFPSVYEAMKNDDVLKILLENNEEKYNISIK